MSDKTDQTEMVRDAEADLAICDAATPGPWSPGCFATGATESHCQCKFIFDEGHAGAIGEVYADNGKPISEGGNVCPPADEARANLIYICTSRTALPYWIRRAIAAEERKTMAYDNCDSSIDAINHVLQAERKRADELQSALDFERTYISAQPDFKLVGESVLMQVAVDNDHFDWVPAQKFELFNALQGVVREMRAEREAREKAEATCAAYKKFLQAESHWLDWRLEDGYDSDSASAKNAEKLRKFVFENGDPGTALLDELNELREERETAERRIAELEAELKWSGNVIVSLEKKPEDETIYSGYGYAFDQWCNFSGLCFDRSNDARPEFLQARDQVEKLKGRVAELEAERDRLDQDNEIFRCDIASALGRTAEFTGMKFVDAVRALRARRDRLRAALTEILSMVPDIEITHGNSIEAVTRHELWVIRNLAKSALEGEKEETK